MKNIIYNSLLSAPAFGKILCTALFTLIVCFSTYAQNLEEYKYIIVPEEFSILNEPDEYGLNTATRQQLRSYGFQAYFEKETLPFNLRNSLCDILNLSVEQESSLLRTKIKLVLSDCEGRPVYTSQLGESKEKSYQKAYVEAFRKALRSFKTLELKKYNSGNEAQFEVVKSEEVQNGIVKEGKVVGNTKKDFEMASTEIIEDGSPKNVSNFISPDGLYKVYQSDNILKFFEGSKEIGTAQSDRNSSFVVETIEFSGEAFFRKGDLVLIRYIKGVGEVEMVFRRVN